MNSVMLRAMQEELMVINKEAALNKEAFLSAVGSGVVNAGLKGLQAVASKGGAIGGMAQKASKAGTGLLNSGVKRFGEKNLAKGLGAATLGAGALAAGGLGVAAGRSSRR